MSGKTDPRCKRIFAALSEYLDGALPAKNCRDLEQHLQGCEPCVAYIENLKTTIKACREYRVRRVPKPSPTVRNALLKALRKP